MNRFFSNLFGITLLLFAVYPVAAQEMKTAEDGLFELAKINEADLYIDATNIDPRQTAEWPVQPGDKRNYFNRWAQRHKLSMLMQKDDFFGWAEPEIQTVADDLLKGEGLHTEKGLPSQFDFYLRTRRLLERKPELRKILSKPVPLQDLPTEIANPVAAILVAFELGNYPSQTLYSKVFEDAFWNNSQIKVSAISPDTKYLYDADWPFPLQTILQDQHPRRLLEYSPLQLTGRRRNIESLLRAENQTIKTKEGNIARRTLELRNHNENENDLRLTETRQPHQTVAERVIERRPSKAAPETPWTKIEDPVQIEQVLIRLGEVPAFPNLGEKSRQELAKYAVSGTQLPDEEALYKEVSFEVRRQALPEFVAGLQKQSGVKLALQGMDGQNVTDAEIAKLLITARIVQKPVGAVLLNLDRLFGIIWKQQAPGNYVGFVRSRQDWRLRLAQFGDFLLYRSRNAITPEGQAVWQQRINAVTHKVGNYFRTHPDLPPLINFTHLPAELQKEVRQEAERRARYGLVQNQIRALEALRGQVSIELPPDTLQFRVYFGGEPGVLIPPGRPEGIIGPFMKPDRKLPTRPVNQ